MYDVRSEWLELVIKYPRGNKPLYIGVLFANSSVKQAAALNQDR